MAAVKAAEAERLRVESTLWEAGAVGEERTAEVLERLELAPLRVLHDRLLRPGESETNIDHLVVCTRGVVLIDTKNWAGAVTVHNGGIWRHHTTQHGRVSEAASKYLHMLRHAADRVRAAGPFPVVPVLCLAGESGNRVVEPHEVAGVHVVPLTGLADWLRDQPERLAAGDVVTRAVELSAQFPPAVNAGLTIVPALGTRAPSGATAPGRPSTTRHRRVPPPRRRSGPVRFALAALVLAGMAAAAQPVAHLIDSAVL